jgi:endonuclease/exonuclease/phosphatase family metal-dependent hydrolase
MRRDQPLRRSAGARVVSGSRATTALALWLACSGVGAAPVAELVLASWNLEHLAAADGAGCRPRFADDYAQLRRIAAGLDADIVALQEVEDATAVARVFDPARYAVVVSPRRERDLGDCRGRPGQARTPQRTALVIDRERLDARGLRWQELEPLRALGIEGRRWGTRILIRPRSGGAGLELVSLHLKSGCAWGRLDGPKVKREQCLILRRQRGILEEWIDQRGGADRPFVLIGDFNRQLDQPRDDFWREIDDGEVCRWREDRRLGRRCEPGTSVPDADADLVLANAGEPFPFPFKPRYPYAVDHFVFSGRAGDWIVPDSYRAIAYEQVPKPSDHHPITIRIRWPEPSR